MRLKDLQDIFKKIDYQKYKIDMLFSYDYNNIYFLNSKSYFVKDYPYLLERYIFDNYIEFIIDKMS